MDRRTAIKAIGAVGATAVVGTGQEALAFNGEGARTGRLKAGAITAKPLRGRTKYMAMVDDASYWPPGNYRTQIEAVDLRGFPFHPNRIPGVYPSLVPCELNGFQIAGRPSVTEVVSCIAWDENVSESYLEAVKAMQEVIRERGLKILPGEKQIEFEFETYSGGPWLPYPGSGPVRMIFWTPDHQLSHIVPDLARRIHTLDFVAWSREHKPEVWDAVYDGEQLHQFWTKFIAKVKIRIPVQRA